MTNDTGRGRARSGQPGIRIRTAAVGDAAALAQLARLTFPLACPPGTATAAIEEFLASQLSEQRFRDYVADPAREVLLLSVGGSLVGYSMTVYGPAADPAVAALLPIGYTAELSKFYLLAAQHGSGRAVTLMTSTLAAAAKRRVTGLWLGVNQRNARAIRFYRRCGFEVMGTKTFWVGPELHQDFVLARPTAR